MEGLSLSLTQYTFFKECKKQLAVNLCAFNLHFLQSLILIFLFVYSDGKKGTGHLTKWSDACDHHGLVAGFLDSLVELGGHVTSGSLVTGMWASTLDAEEDEVLHYACRVHCDHLADATEGRVFLLVSYDAQRGAPAERARVLDGRHAPTSTRTTHQQPASWHAHMEPNTITAHRLGKVIFRLASSTTLWEKLGKSRLCIKYVLLNGCDLWKLIRLFYH